MSAYTDQELRDHAANFASKDEWRRAGLDERQQGVPSHYHIAVDRGKEFFQSCCIHMKEQRGKSLACHQHQKYTDEELIETAKKYQHKCDWRKADKPSYDAAVRRPEVWKLATAHMTPACNPYAGDYIVYAFEFADNHVYVGITFNEDDRMAGHGCRGPVFEHKKVCPQVEFKRVQTNIMSPAEAAQAEKDWVTKYQAEGRTLLNVALPGGLGGMMPRWTKAALIYDAQKYPTRKAWQLGSQYAYKLARRKGWFEEATEHMPTPAESQRGRRGETRSAEAKERMSVSKKTWWSAANATPLGPP